jgi:SAM-dependent methyltransferase
VVRRTAPARALRGLAGQLPWWGKIAAKLLLARLPLSFPTWKRLGWLELGYMEQPEHAYRVFKAHFDLAGLRNPSDGFVGLELGPGDAVSSALVARSFGSSAYHLVDVDAFAQTDVACYRALARYLEQLGLPVPKMEGATSLDDVLALCGATYRTSGLASLRTLPDRSIDFIWSNTVLQHVRRSEFLETMGELRRVLRPGGVCSHVLDLADTVGGALNNLRFPERLWESRLVAESGFYTNRLRYSELLAHFAAVGFRADVVNITRWTTPPTPRSKLARQFRRFSDDDLCVSGFHVVLRPT